MRAEKAIDFSRTLVVLEEGAEATLLAETASASPDAAGLHCGTIELIVGAGAKLRPLSCTTTKCACSAPPTAQKRPCAF